VGSQLVTEEITVRGRKVTLKTLTYGELKEIRKKSVDLETLRVDPWEFNHWLLVKTVVKWDLDVPIDYNAISNIDDPQLIELLEEIIHESQRLNLITRSEEKKSSGL
jgi:hypothetical protein